MQVRKRNNITLLQLLADLLARWLTRITQPLVKLNAISTPDKRRTKQKSEINETSKHSFVFSLLACADHVVQRIERHEDSNNCHRDTRPRRATDEEQEPENQL